MKSVQNLFGLLGLDPHYLRGVPDEIVGQIVKSAFRNLIAYYHDDKRNFPDDTYDKKQKTNFDRRRDEIMEAHRILSTPEGRLKELSNFRQSTTSDLKTQLTAERVNTNEVVKSYSLNMLQHILDRVGALPKLNHGSSVGILSGGRILTSFNSDFRHLGVAYEFSLGSGGQVADLAEFRIEIAKNVKNVQKQVWYMKGSQIRSDWCAVRVKTMYAPKWFTVIGSIEERDFNTYVGPEPKALLQGESSKLLTGLPFYRLCADRMLGLMGSLSPVIMRSSILVLVDAKGTFYFAGNIRSTISSLELNGLGGKLS